MVAWLGEKAPVGFLLVPGGVLKFDFGFLVRATLGLLFETLATT